MNDARCAVVARELDEPLAGTAPHAPRWVCLEQRGAWPHDVTACADPAVAAFTARAAAHGWKPLLIRRPRRRIEEDAGPVRLLFADTRTTQLTTLTVAGPEELAGIPLDGLPGEPLLDPVLLVCTNGRRDRCCALEGRALALAVAGSGDVWECTHLGGHRFAPTALVLPTGYAYGRLDTATALSALKAAAVGEVEPARCRGRSTWSPAGQVAELAVRASAHIADAAALTWADGAVTAADGRRWAVDVRAVELPARPKSCGVAPLPVTTWQVEAVRAEQ